MNRPTWWQALPGSTHIKLLMLGLLMVITAAQFVSIAAFHSPNLFTSTTTAAHNLTTANNAASPAP